MLECLLSSSRTSSLHVYHITLVAFISRFISCSSVTIMEALHNRVSNMTFQEMMADAWNNSKSRLKQDPMDMITPEMKRNMTPASLQCMSIFGISYFVIVMIIIIITSFGWTMPVVYDGDPETHSTRLWISLFMLFNVVINFALTVTKPGFYKGVKTAESVGLIPDINWHKCIDCDHLSPPRTHHCPLCGKCVLKRDHHCFFTGSCVGYDNQRYFIVFCFYCALGTAYAFYVNFQFLTLEYSHPSFWTLHHFLLPVTFFEWLFGYCTLGFLYYVFLVWLCICTCLGSTGIFCWQFFLAAWGTTTHEYWKANSTYRVGIRRHLRSVFGSFWFVNFIVPLPFLKQSGNGMDWGTCKAM